MPSHLAQGFRNLHSVKALLAFASLHILQARNKPTNMSLVPGWRLWLGGSTYIAVI